MTAKIYYREFWGVKKLDELSQSVNSAFDINKCKVLNPQSVIGSPFVVTHNSENYFDWPDLREIFVQDFSGVQTKRDSFLVDIDRDKLTERLEIFFDVNIHDDDLHSQYPDSLKNLNNNSATRARKKFVNRGLLSDNFFEYNYKPFDRRYLYWEGDYGYLGTPSHKFVSAIRNIPDNFYLEFRKKENKLNFSRFFISQTLADNMGNGFSNYLPLKYIDEYGKTKFNIRKSVFLNAKILDEEQLFYFVVAVLHSSKYRIENGSILTKSLPRIPNDFDEDSMAELSKFGRDLCSYYCSGISNSCLNSLMGSIGIPDFNGVPDLSIDAEWGRSDPKGAVFPGAGLPLIHTGSDKITHPKTGAILDVASCVLPLNHSLKLKTVPVEILDFEISGYKVIKKWLSYRAEPVLQRELSHQELEELKLIIIKLFLISITSKDIDSVIPLLSSK